MSHKVQEAFAMCKSRYDFGFWAYLLTPRRNTELISSFKQVQWKY